MDKKSKVFLWVLFLLILVSAGATYWRIMIKKDYIVEAQMDCDPTMERCFIYECDPEMEECTGDPAEDISYYKLIHRNASNIPLCDPADENCQALACKEDEKECFVTFCSDETKTDEDICSDPGQYNLEQSLMYETGADCKDGSIECSAITETKVCDVEDDPACENDVVVEEINDNPDFDLE